MTSPLIPKPDTAIDCQVDDDQRCLIDLAQTSAADRLLAQESLARLVRQGLVHQQIRQRPPRLADPLDPWQIAGHLSPSVAARLRCVRAVAITESTQLWASRHDGACFAEVQTAGQGRRGRQWRAVAGSSLQFSLGLPVAANVAARPGALPLVVAVAVVEALTVSFPGIAIKWPNDIVCQHGKLAGILLGMETLAGQSRLVCGLGLNIEAPSGVDQPAAGLDQLSDVSPERNRLAGRLLESIIAAIIDYEVKGFAAFARRYAQFDALESQWVTLRSAEGTRLYAGTVCGVADDGALRLDCQGVEKRFYSGEVQMEKPRSC